MVVAKEEKVFVKYSSHVLIMNKTISESVASFDIPMEEFPLYFEKLKELKNIKEINVEGNEIQLWYREERIVYKFTFPSVSTIEKVLKLAEIQIK